MQKQLRRPALYVVATPIGNLGDITLRACEVLRAVDLVVAEDTRVTGRLLAHLQIQKPLLALHRHNERRATERVLSAFDQGQAVALASDAGTPGVSDPGALLVQSARAHGVAVLPIPGPSALAAAWSVSGMSGPLHFQGFLPSRPGERRKTLTNLAQLGSALVFYEAPHRVLATARDLVQVLGGARQAVIARELTKVFEQVHGCTLAELPGWLEEDADRSRGELVLIVSPPSEPEPDEGLAEVALRVLLEELSPAQAARLAARICGVPRGTLYDLALKLRGKD